MNKMIPGINEMRELGQNAIELSEASVVEISLNKSRLWVNINGVCVLRIKKMEKFEMNSIPQDEP